MISLLLLNKTEDYFSYKKKETRKMAESIKVEMFRGEKYGIPRSSRMILNSWRNRG